jgi:cleavage and polyadenylation specificity factor subunit 4
MAAAATANVAAQMLAGTKPSYTFTFTPFLQTAYQHSLPADRPICKTYASSGKCPNGTRCTERHVSTAATAEMQQQRSHGQNSTVCKHWLRALCKKGEGCDFLHEYNLRKMPECNFFARNGYCTNGDECLYLHIDPASKLPPCPHYEKGFCELGPRCSRRHLRRTLCPYYLAGFCPAGRACKDGVHPKWDTNLEKPTEKKAEEEKEAARIAEREEEDERERSRERERDRDRQDGGRFDRGHRDNKFGGGRGGGKWRGKGKFRGGRH